MLNPDGLRRAILLTVMLVAGLAWGQERELGERPVHHLPGGRDQHRRLPAGQMSERVLPSLVRAYWPQSESSGVCFGFSVGEGRFLSVWSDARLAEEVVLQASGGQMKAKVVLMDPASGLVILKTSNRLHESIPALPLGTSKTFYVGDSILALRIDPVRVQPDHSVVGLVIGRDRKLNGKALPVSRLRLQVPHLMSTGGLPIFDHSGRVVAIDLGQDLDDDGEEFHALPIEVAAKLIADLSEFGRREEAWIGLQFNTGTTTAKVVGVRPGSPGAQAGVQTGDVVIHFAGASIDTLDDLAESCYTLTPGQAAEIHVLRGVDRIEGELIPSLLSARSRVGPDEPRP